jgi:endo-1,4-beta-xylanase
MILLGRVGMGQARTEPSGPAPKANQPGAVAPTASGTTLRVKAGLSTPFTDSNGQVWLPEQGFEGGATAAREPGIAIAGTRDPALYLSERHALRAFSCKVPSGKYLAKLHFAETSEAITGPGQRVFSCNVQGHELKDLDIWARAGGPHRAHVETVSVEVTDGELRIVFESRIGDPKINAIEILPQATGEGDAKAPGRPAEQDVPALKEVFKDRFLIGGALNRSVVTGRDSNAAAIAEKHFNTATAENDFKWQLIHPQLDQYRWEPADRFVELCEKQRMVIIGHCLVWHSQVPRWVFLDDAGGDLSRDALLARMKDHILSVVGRYKGRIRGWDVVNEALEEDGTLRSSRWLRIIGEGSEDKRYDFIESAFRWAHEADPGAELYYNDYNLETSKAKCEGAVAIVKHLKSRGIRIDGVGIQLHGGLTYPGVESLEHAITSLAATGVKVMITELDIRTRARGYRGADVGRVTRQGTSDPDAEAAETQRKLAEKYAEIFAVLLKHEKLIDRVTFWGVHDGASWIGGSPLLFDRSYRPKEAFFAVIKTAREGRKE